jgi:hypothetical protein
VIDPIVGAGARSAVRSRGLEHAGLEAIPCRNPTRGHPNLSFYGVFDVLSRFVQRASCVVARPLCQSVLVQGTVSLPGHVKNLSEVYVYPYLDPLGYEVAIQRLPELVD